MSSILKPIDLPTGELNSKANMFSKAVEIRLSDIGEKYVDMQRLRYNVEKIKQYCKDQNQDWIVLITGGEGTGKSTVGRHMAEMFDPKFDVETQMVYSFNEEYSYLKFIKDFRHKPYRAVVFDEAVTALFSRDHAKSEVRDAIKIFNLNRQLNHFSILIVPSFWSIDVDIRERRARSMLYVFQDEYNYSRRFAYFSRKKIPNISSNDHARKVFLSSALFLKYFKPNFIEAFPKMSAEKELAYDVLKKDHFTTFIDELDDKYNKSPAAKMDMRFRKNRQAKGLEVKPDPSCYTKVKTDMRLKKNRIEAGLDVAGMDVKEEPKVKRPRGRPRKILADKF